MGRVINRMATAGTGIVNTAVSRWHVSAVMRNGPVTGQVDTVNGVIVAAPPVWGRFKGQRMEALLGWLQHWGVGNRRPEVVLL